MLRRPELLRPVVLPAVVLRRPDLLRSAELLLREQVLRSAVVLLPAELWLPEPLRLLFVLLLRSRPVRRPEAALRQPVLLP